MNIEELKITLQHLANSEPEWFAELIGDVVKENLSVEEQEYTPTAAQLCWKDSSDGLMKVFSCA